jgi:hypothetical protein
MGVLGCADRMQFGRDAAWLAGGLSAAFGGLVGSESEWARLPSPEAAFLRGPARGSQNRKGAGRSRRRDTVITTRDTRVPFWKSTMGSQSGNSKTARMKHRHAHDPRSHRGNRDDNRNLLRVRTCQGFDELERPPQEVSDSGTDSKLATHSGWEANNLGNSRFQSTDRLSGP